MAEHSAEEAAKFAAGAAAVTGKKFEEVDQGEYSGCFGFDVL